MDAVCTTAGHTMRHVDGRLNGLVDGVAQRGLLVVHLTVHFLRQMLRRQRLVVLCPVGEVLVGGVLGLHLLSNAKVGLNTLHHTQCLGESIVGGVSMRNRVHSGAGEALCE